ncbi:MAG: undecaprenyldiphospho-muramoylpentapeptide beta-N-acetylglucosaminyltransferase [Candidatus Binatia bacterium]
MRLIMAGGGTGGHLFPGLAVAREFQRRDAGTDILFVGSKWGIESRVVPQEGFSLRPLPIRGLKGRGLLGFMQALYSLPISFFRSLGIIRGFRPECIIGLGGYASGPLLFAGTIRRIRCAIMEQNLRPGLTNRILGWMVDRIFTSFEESAPYFPRSKVVDTGTPVRWHGLPRVGAREKLTLFVFGGSAGAHRINVCVLDALGRIKNLAPRLRVVHQTGEADFESIRAAYSTLGFESEVHPFIQEMDMAYAAANLIVCRAGASTVAEITAFGKAAILVPYPRAAYDHQRWNAQALKARGAAEMILDQELNGERLAEMIRTLCLDRSRLAALEKAAAKMGRPESAKWIVDECYALMDRDRAACS